MRKIIVLLILLLLINLMVFAGSLDKDTLTLVVPGDSVTIGFSSDSEGKNVMTASTSKLSSVKTPDWNSSTENYNSYATAYLEFYVFWDVFVSSGFKLTLTVPENFKNAKTGETLNIIASGDGMPSSEGNPQVLASKESYDIATIKADSVNSGSKKCIIAVDISKAKYGATYKGTLYLKMETVS